VASRSVRHTQKIRENEHVSKRYEHYLGTVRTCHLGPLGPIGQARMGSCGGEKLTRRSWYGAAERFTRSAPRVCSCVWMRVVGSDGQQGELRREWVRGEDTPTLAPIPPLENTRFPPAIPQRYPPRSTSPFRAPAHLPCPSSARARRTVTNQDTPTLLSADLPMLADVSANTQARTYIHKKFNHPRVPT
jgi:hypothetical protein